jgi:Domain of unknown function (DUF6883)
MTDWILGEKGHAEEWRRVFQTEAEEAEVVWKSIAKAVSNARITEVRGHGHGHGASYGVIVKLRINGRVAPVVTAWHYEDPEAPPRLVTAYPKLYTRRNGDYG